MNIYKRQMRDLGVDTIYPLVCQLYDCLELGNIKGKNEVIKSVKGFQKKEYTKEEKELRNWFTKYDINKFIKTNHITYKMLESEIGVSIKSLYAVIHKRYIPSCETITKLKDYVERIENKDNLIMPDQHNDMVIDGNVMKPVDVYTNDFFTITNTTGDIKLLYNNNEEILRNLLKDRLTEEEKTLIKIFGGNI